MASVSAACPEASASAGDPAFQRRDALLEDVGGRVHDAGVDVAELLQGEQPRGVVGVVEHVRRGLVDRHGARLGCGVDLLAAVDGEGVEVEGWLSVCVTHCCTLLFGVLGFWPKNKTTHSLSDCGSFRNLAAYLLFYSPLLRATHRPTRVHMHMAIVLIGVVVGVALHM